MDTFTTPLEHLQLWLRVVKDTTYYLCHDNPLSFTLLRPKWDQLSSKLRRLEIWTKISLISTFGLLRSVNGVMSKYLIGQREHNVTGPGTGTLWSNKAWGGGASHWSQTMPAPPKKKKKIVSSSERSGANGNGPQFVRHASSVVIITLII